MKIVTDAAADLPAEDITTLEITPAPLFIQFPEGEVSSLEISADEFYNRLRAMYPKIPTTAQPSPGIFAQIYRNLYTPGEEILSVHISSGLSGTIQAARIAAQEVDPDHITLFDTFTLSGGERFHVLAAAMAARAGWSKDKIVARLQEIKAVTEVIYTLDTLEYLEKGGRIGRVQSLLGTLFKIKPVINVAKEDGKYSTIGKARSIQRAQTLITEYLQQKYANSPVWINVLHGQWPQQADSLLQQLQESLVVKKSEIQRVSPVLGVHTGPGIVGVAVVPFALMEDLLPLS